MLAEAQLQQAAQFFLSSSSDDDDASDDAEQPKTSHEGAKRPTDAAGGANAPKAEKKRKRKDRKCDACCYNFRHMKLLCQYRYLRYL